MSFSFLGRRPLINTLCPKLCLSVCFQRAHPGRYAASNLPLGHWASPDSGRMGLGEGSTAIRKARRWAGSGLAGLRPGGEHVQPSVSWSSCFPGEARDLDFKVQSPTS